MNSAAPLLRTTVCPHCWDEFPVEDVLWISSHPNLLGDPKLGPEHQGRFLPKRFTVDGHAVDSLGLPCHALACPACHLPVPRAALEMETLFVSIFGEEECGKSSFLTTMAWELRRRLPKQFGLSFTDADTISNQALNEYENGLFLNPQANDLVPVNQLIPKTPQSGGLYDLVTLDNQQVSYPRPFLFAISPRENHPRFSDREQLARLVCLYDNAGARFRPGEDYPTHPDTQHLLHARFLLFLFDPTQDPRFLALINRGRDRSAPIVPSRASRQDMILLEAAARIRRHTGLSPRDKHNRPLTVVVTKFDLWSSLIDKPDLVEPWLHVGELVGLDLNRIEKISGEVRDLMASVCPEVVNAAESFAPSVTYVPVSALGRFPAQEAGDGTLASIRPRDIRPTWVTVPLLHALCRGFSRLVPIVKRKPWHEPPSLTASGDSIRCNALPDF
jgi:hypothetical protein